MRSIFKNISLKLLLVGLLFLLHFDGRAQNTNRKIGWPFSQDVLKCCNIDTNDITKIRHLADSCCYSISDRAAIFLAQRGYKDIMPRLLECLDSALKSEHFTRTFHYTIAVATLDTSLGRYYAHVLYDTMYIRKRERGIRYSNDDFCDVINLLLDLKDYSKYQDFKSFFFSNDRPYNPYYIEGFARFAQNPALETDAYETVKQFLNDNDEEYRFRALVTLFRFKNFPERINLIKNVGLKDTNGKIRHYAASYLEMIGYIYDAIQCYQELVRSQIDTFYSGYSIYELEDINSPYALSALLELRNQLEAGPLLDRLMLTLELYSPWQYSYDRLEIKVYIDSLRAFIQQCRALGWISDTDFLSELDNYLIEAQRALLSGDSIGCARNIKQFQQAVDAEYHDTLNVTPAKVTTEGWRFLYYNAQYILDRLPAIPAEPIITQLEPSFTYANSGAFSIEVTGKNFTEGSVAYWQETFGMSEAMLQMQEGTMKPTVFISDSMLEVEISAEEIMMPDVYALMVRTPYGGRSNYAYFRVMTQPTIYEMIDSLRREMRLYYEMKKLGKKGLYEELDRQLEGASRRYSAGDSVGSSLEIDDFQQILREVYYRNPARIHRKPYRDRYINKITSEILNNRAQLIKSRIIVLPARLMGAIAEQMEVIGGQIHEAGIQGKIVNQEIVKGLLRIIEVAKKELVRGDTIGAALQMKLIRQTLRRIYEMRSQRIYIDEKTYVVLYYELGYILEQMPEEQYRTDRPMPRLSEDIEREIRKK